MSDRLSMDITESGTPVQSSKQESTMDQKECESVLEDLVSKDKK